MQCDRGAAGDFIGGTQDGATLQVVATQCERRHVSEPD
jgi:hypothetical protein